MGYYTQYKLKIEANLDIFSLIEEDFHDGKIPTEYGTLKDIFPYMGDFSDECKWYGHNEDMLAISTQYPNVTFVLEGHGEETGDVWKKWYRNGNVHVSKPELVYEPPTTEFYNDVDDDKLQRRLKISREISKLSKELRQL